MNPLPSPALGEKIIHFNPEERIAALEELNRDLRIKNDALVMQNNGLSIFVNYIAQRYFSTDDDARWFAGKNGARVTVKVAHAHWARNGGREQFAKDFPTAMHVVRFFTRTASVRERLRKLLHTS